MNNTEFKGFEVGMGTGIYAYESKRIEVNGCIFNGLYRGMRIESYANAGSILLQNLLPTIRRSDFMGNTQGVYMHTTPGINIYDSKISGGEVGVYGQFTVALNLKNTEIWGYQDAGINHNATRIKGAVVANNLGTITMQGGRIYDNKIGVYSPEDTYINRVVLRDNAVIEGNDVGIEMYGHVEGFAGVDQAGNGYTELGSGGLWVDCSAIRQNKRYGVYGEDILLKIDALDPSTGSNDFEHDLLGSKIFGIVYKEYDIGNTILARNNYWDEVNCPNYPNNYYLQYNAPISNITLDVGTSCNELFACEAPDPEDPKFPEEEVCDGRLEEKSSGSIHETLEMGFIQLWYEDYTGAATTLAPIAQMADRDIDRLDGVCRQDIYLARLIAPQNPDQGSALKNSSSSLEVNEKSNTEDIRLAPNPTSDHFSLHIPQGDYNVEIYNMLGQSVLQTQIFENTDFQTNTWDSGVYFIRVFNNMTKQFFEEKLIVE